MIQISLSSVNNNGLFAQHYLENRLPEMEEWEEPEGLEEAFEEIKQLWKEEKEYMETEPKEDPTKKRLINPILEVLNHFSEQEPQKTISGESYNPDYLFFKNKKQHLKVTKDKNKDKFDHSLGIGEAKRWNSKLDKTTTDHKNPSFQIFNYVDRLRINWGILTNGKKWRVYSYEEQGSDIYYEIDLINILEKQDREEALQEFKYFYLFFRQKAFKPKKDSFLARILEQSQKYSQRIGENLEDSVYKALRWMAKGYYQNKSNWQDPKYPKFLRSNQINFSELSDDEEEEVRELVDEIHHNSLIFLYRLLFLFYAESKDKLGREVPKNYSFDNWVDDVLNDIDQGEINPKGGLYNYGLEDIFKLLKEGSKGMGIDDQFFVPAYNGNLFEKKEFLNQNNIHDGYVAEVVDLLARDPLEDEPGKGRVDYSDLSIRHIGGIYEGLLEYQLKIAKQDMVAEKEEWKPLTKANKDLSEYDEVNRAREGEIYLATDKGERKATGSYFTPDYIVEYIIQNTVKPKVEEKLEGLKTDKEKKEAILDINVLDPAMGSGHFLVDTLDYLSNKLVKYVPENIEGKEIDWAKRKVVRNCLYGVDINPLATELAKVSLWLETMTEDKPLPFLDHHLRTGNSLIGANLDDLQTHPDTDKGKKDQEKESKPEEKPETDKDSQVNLLDFVEKNEEDNGESIEEKIDEILETQKEIMETTESRPDDIKKEKKIYQRFRNNDLLLRLKMLADIHTSHYFGNEYTKEQYEELKNSLTQKEWKEIAEQEWIKKYTNNLPKKYNKDNNLAKQKLFFHWQLEFPRVFFDEQKGFDAVIGNPPYVKIQNIPKDFRDYSEDNYQVADERYDLYGLFVERGSSISESKMSYILPNKFFESNAGKSLREFLSSESLVEEIVDFSQIQIFEDVTTYTCILTLSQNSKNPQYTELSSEPQRILDSPQFSEVEISTGDEKWNLLKTEEKEVISKIENRGKDFFEVADQIFVGIQTSDDKAFVLRDCTVNKEEGTIEGNSKTLEQNVTIESGLAKPYVGGRDLHRYQQPKTDDYLIYPYDSEGNLIEEQELGENYPKTYSYLKENKDRLSDRGSEDQVFDSWYAHWCPRKPKKFEREKILIPEIAKHGKLTYDPNEEIYHSTTVYSPIISEEYAESDKEVLGLLNSSLVWFYIKKTGTVLRGGYYRYKTDYLEPISLVLQEDTLQDYVEKNLRLSSELASINLNIEDYLGNSVEDPDGQTLGELYMPVEGLSDRSVSDTSADRDSLRIGGVGFEESNGDLVLKVSARYKPDDSEGIGEDELDQWGYFETEKVPAMKFDVDEKLKPLIEEFVSLAVNEAGGFANFRKSATKTNSIVDRLEKLTLPKLEDVEQGLEKFIENREEAEELEEKIKETDEQIDAIVFDLYDLTESEVETVLDSLDTDNKVKKDILSKFRDIKG